MAFERRVFFSGKVVRLQCFEWFKRVKGFFKKRVSFRLTAIEFSSIYTTKWLPAQFQLPSIHQSTPFTPITRSHPPFPMVTTNLTSVSSFLVYLFIWFVSRWNGLRHPAKQTRWPSVLYTSLNTWFPRPAVIASHGKLLGTSIIKYHPGLTESETLGVGP